MATELHYDLYEQLVGFVSFVINNGTNNPAIEFYDGSKPWDGEPDGHTLLVSFEVTAGFVATGRSIVIADGNPIVASPVASGTATWFRVVGGYEEPLPPELPSLTVIYGDVDGNTVGFEGPSGNDIEVGTDVTLSFASFSLMEG